MYIKNWYLWWSAFLLVWSVVPILRIAKWNDWTPMDVSFLGYFIGFLWLNTMGLKRSIGIYLEYSYSIPRTWYLLPKTEYGNNRSSTSGRQFEIENNNACMQMNHWAYNKKTKALQSELKKKTNQKHFDISFLIFDRNNFFQFDNRFFYIFYLGMIIYDKVQYIPSIGNNHSHQRNVEIYAHETWAITP